MQYWQISSGSSMKLSGSLRWTVMIPEFIVGDVKFWLRSEWIFPGSYSVIVLFICVFKSFSLFSLRIFYVFFLCINKMSVFVGIFHSADIVIWIFKAYWVHFLLMAINCILRRICVGCISVFIEFLGSWSIYFIVLKELLFGWLFLYEKYSSEGTSF